MLAYPALTFLHCKENCFRTLLFDSVVLTICLQLLFIVSHHSYMNQTHIWTFPCEKTYTHIYNSPLSNEVFHIYSVAEGGLQMVDQVCSWPNPLAQTNPHLCQAVRVIGTDAICHNQQLQLHTENYSLYVQQPYSNFTEYSWLFIQFMRKILDNIDVTTLGLVLTLTLHLFQRATAHFTEILLYDFS